MSIITDAIAAIEAQQPKERSSVWMVGEQLKDIVRGDEDTARIVLTDLENNKDMTLAAAEKKIEETARKNKVGRCGCVTPVEAEDIIRKFFGLGDREAEEKKPERGKILDLADFL